MTTVLNEKQRALADRMSEISEEAYCAGWMSGLEYDLWRIVLAGGGEYGFYQVDEGAVRDLRTLAADCRGWIIFDDDHEEMFVPEERWLEMFAAFEDRQHSGG